MMIRKRAGSRAIKRKRKPRGAGHERRGEILAAAKALFIKEGYETVTTRQLARRAGISQTALYVYFANKEAIYDALCGETFAELARRVDDVVASGAPSKEQPRALMRALIEFALAHPDEYQLTFMVTHPALVAAHKKDLSLPREKQGPGMKSFLRFRDEIARLTKGKVLPDKDPTLTAQVMLCAAHGVAAMLIARPWYPWLEREALIDAVVDAVVTGLR